MHISILERRKLKAAALAVALTAPIAGFESYATAGVVNPGDVVVDQVSNATNNLTNSGTAVILDIYTPTVGVGNSVTLALDTTASNGTIPLPTALSSNGLASNPLVQSGTATSEGEITISPDGSTIVVPGYDANAGVGANGMSNNTSSIAGSNSTVIARDIGLVYAATGAIDTSTTTTAFNGNNPRSAAYLGGTTLYAAGAATPGVTQLTVDSTNGNGVQLQNTVVNTRQLQLFNGGLYVSDSSGSAVNLFQVNGFDGSTANSGTAAQLPGLSVSNNATQNTSGTKIFAPYGFAFANGGSTLYVADQGGNGSNGSGTGTIEKFILSSGSYIADGSVAIGTNNVTGLSAEALTGSSGSFEAIFATTPTGIYEISDSGGSLTGDTLNTEITDSGTTQAFRGVATDVVPVPEPTVMSAILLASGAGLLRRKRRCPSLKT